jgi:uncharacterized protein (TIGR02145 family)
MNSKFRIMLITVLLNSVPLLPFAQSVGINDNGSIPNSKAILDVKSTSKGMLIPRMTSAQIGAIVNPADGLQVYNTDNGKINVYVASEVMWKELSYGTGTITPPTNSQFVVCGNSFIDTRDGKTYPTVLIGTQCWMAKNLNIGVRIDGTVGQTNNGIIEKSCYNDFESNCDIYGGLYWWDEFMNYTSSSDSVPSGRQGICPSGWHIPSDVEWTILSGFLGGNQIAGKKMKETGTEHWIPPNKYADNSSGFTGLPGGLYSPYDCHYFAIGNYAEFWTCTDIFLTHAFARDLYLGNTQLEVTYPSKINFFSGRCIKD